MTLDLKIAFLVFFFGVWAVLGLLPWLVATVARRGRGAGLALPLALAGGWAAGVAVPFLGADDGRGFLISLGTALAGGLFLSQIGFRLAGKRTARAKEAKDGEGVSVHHVGPGAI